MGNNEEILEKARASAAEKREEHEEATTEMTERLEAERAQQQAEAAERAERVRKAVLDDAAQDMVKAPSAETAPTHNPRTQGATEWGPYDDYEIVTTRYGEYAVEPGYKMFFESYEFFDSREKRMRTSMRPVYVWAIPGHKDFGKTRDELVRGYRPGEVHIPKPVEPAV